MKTKKEVLKALVKHAAEGTPIAKADFAEEWDISTATVRNYIKMLKDRGIIVQTTDRRGAEPQLDAALDEAEALFQSLTAETE